MKVRNMTSSRGNDVPNQFIISGVTIRNSLFEGDMFQSYDSSIVFIDNRGNVFLDKRYWDYSVTTGRYRNQFLNETKKETQAKIDNGEYILTDLNGGD